MHPTELKPGDRAEEIAIFRATILGPVLLRDLAHGQLANELRALSEARYRPPGATSTRTYQVPTLEHDDAPALAGGTSRSALARRCLSRDHVQGGWQADPDSHSRHAR